MSTTIATLKALLTLDVSDFTNNARRAEGDGERMSSNLLGGAKKFAMFGAAAAAAAVPVGMFLKGAIDNASDLEETISKNKTIFGSAADGLMAWASDAPKALGMTKNAALDATGTLGNLFTQLGIGTDAARKMSQANVQLATDFASFHNADPAEVIDAMTAAYRGEFDAVQRFVPLLNAANVEEKALTMSKKKSKDALTEQDKALAVNALMMEGAGAAAGDFARTSDSAANRARIAAAGFEEMKTKIGNVLLPAWTALLGFVTGSFFPAMEKLAGFIGSVLGPVFEKVSAAVRLFIGAFTGEGAEVGDVLGGWMNPIIDLGATAARIFAGIKDAWSLLTTGMVSDELETNLGSWGPKVKEIADTIRNFAAQVPGWLSQVSDAWSRLTDVVGPFWEKIKGNEAVLITVGILLGVVLVNAFIALAAAAWSAAAGVIAATWPFIAIAAVIFGVVAALKYAYENWEWFRTGVQAVVSWLMTNVPPAFEAIKAGLAVVVDWITGTAVPFLQGAFSSFMGFLQGTLLPAVTTVWNAIAAVIGFVAGIVVDIVTRISNFISDNWNWIAGVAAAVWDQIRSLIANAWQIISNIIQLFLNIISGNWSDAWGNIQNIISAAVDMVVGTVLNLGRIIGNVFMLIVSAAGNLLGGVGEKLGALIGWFLDLPIRIMSAIAGLAGDMHAAGARIIGGLIDGIKSKIGGAVDAVKGGLSSIRNLLPFSPAKEGPFSGRGWSMYSGQAIATDFAKGIRAKTATMVSATRAAMSAVAAVTPAGFEGSTGMRHGITAGMQQAGPSSPLRSGPAGAQGLQVIVNGRARSEDGVAVVNAITAWERVAGTTWRNGAQELQASGW